MKRGPRREAMRRELLAEWRGGPEPGDPDANIHAASEHLAAILRLTGWNEGLDEADLKAAWLAIAGEFVARHAEPVSVKDGNLVLRVTQPAMRFHLEQMKAELLRRIQNRFGKEKVKSVKFALG